MLIEVPKREPKPKLGVKPLLVRQAERNRKKDYGYWAHETCGFCGVLIGKDYGSYSHSCKEGQAYRQYYRPLDSWKDGERDREIKSYLRKFQDRLIKVGMDEDTAYRIVANSRPYSLEAAERQMEVYEWFLSRLEKRKR